MPSLTKLAQQLDDAFTVYVPGLPRRVENGAGREELYELRSVISDCIVELERKDGRIVK